MTHGVVRVPDGQVTYRELGTGPAIVIPWCNLAWPDIEVVSRLAEDHRVLLVSPLGYQASTRLRDGAGYGAARAVDEILAVCDTLEIGAFTAFGYSLSGALAAWLATATEKATLAVIGGFPLLGSYARVHDGALDDTAHLDGDPGFDPRAALALYRDLAERPDGDLVVACRAPMRVFLGADDAVLARFSIEADLAGALRQRDVPTTVVEGTDHVSAILATDVILLLFAPPEVRTLASGCRATSR
jgi:pimeloyl-ACP methyl ester carboxylesterase